MLSFPSAVNTQPPVNVPINRPVMAPVMAPACIFSSQQTRLRKREREQMQLTGVRRAMGLQSLGASTKVGWHSVHFWGHVASPLPLLVRARLHSPSNRMRNLQFVLGAGDEEKKGEEGCISCRSFAHDMRREFRRPMLAGRRCQAGPAWSFVVKPHSRDRKVYYKTATNSGKR